MQEQREIERIAHPHRANERAGERQIVDESAALDGGEHADGTDAVLVDRVDVIEVVLGLRHDAPEIRQEAAEHAGLVHHPKNLLRIAPIGEDRAKGAVGLGIVAHRRGDQAMALVDQPQRGRMDVAALGLRPAEDRHEAHRALAEGALAGCGDAPARDQQSVAGGSGDRARAVHRRGVEPLRFQHRAEDPGELAHRLRDQEIVLHEPLDGEIAAPRAVPHARRDLGLHVEGEAILRAAADGVEMGADAPEEVLRPCETDMLVPAQHAASDELAEPVHAEEILGDPEQHVEVAQAALAVLHIGLEQVARIAGAQVTGVALVELGGHELGLGAGDQLGEKTPAERAVEGLIAPHMARFEHRGPDRHVLARLAQAIGDRAGRVADGKAEIPHHVEQVFDDLLASAGPLVGVQEEDVDIGMGRQIAPAVAADRHQGEGARRGRVRLGVDDAGRPLEQDVQQLVDEGGLGRNDLGTRRTGFEAAAELPAAIVAGVPHQRENGRAVIPPEAGDRLRKPLPVEGGRPRAALTHPARRAHSSLRTHRRPRRQTVALDRPPPEREGHAQPGPMARQIAPNAERPQARTGAFP